MRRIFYVLFYILVIISSTGCWSRKEPKSLAVLDSIIYDITEQGMYRTVAEIMNPSAIGGIKGGNGGGNKSPSVTVNSEGRSVSEALRNASQSMERCLFGGHNNVRFFSERFARNDVMPVMDYFLRDHVTDETPLIVVIKGQNPEQIYSCMVGLSDMVGQYVHSLSNIQPTITSKSIFVSTRDFMKDCYTDGKQPVAGAIEIVECKAKPSDNNKISSDNSSGDGKDSKKKRYRIKYEGLAAFKDNRLVGYMNDIEARAYNLVMNKIKKAYVTVPSGKRETVAEIDNSKSKIKVSLDEGRVVLGVKTKMNINIVEESGVLDVSKIGPLKKFETKFNRQLEEEIVRSIRKAQHEFRSDIFGFGQFMHIQHPGEWKKMNKNWDNYFSDAVVNVSVESSVMRTGEIKEPFKMEEQLSGK